MTSIFMFHAVGDPIDIDGSDPHYAVSCEQFTKQILKIGQSVPLADQLAQDGKITTNCITFDDGHLSNFSKAFPILVKHKLSAEFYVNTAFVGDKNYMSWEQLREMQNAGMSIQSHGHHHEYFSDMSESQIESELIQSKKSIEENLGIKVTVFAPPGGRFDNRVVKIAKKLGYQCIATSIPGCVNNGRNFTLPRFAIIHTTNENTVANWCHRFSRDTLKQSLRYSVFSVAKKVLGNKNYERLRGKVLGNGVG